MPKRVWTLKLCPHVIYFVLHSSAACVWCMQVSGEALMGPHGFGVDPDVLSSVAEEVAAATQAGVHIAIVVSGGCGVGGVRRWSCGSDWC